jgi:hypothetical protein
MCSQSSRILKALKDLDESKLKSTGNASYYFNGDRALASLNSCKRRPLQTA